MLHTLFRPRSSAVGRDTMSETDDYVVVLRGANEPDRILTGREAATFLYALMLYCELTGEVVLAESLEDGTERGN